VITPRGRDRVLGATIVGAEAGELIAEFVMAMTHGLGLKRLMSTIHAYPTRAEAAKLTAGAWRRAHAPQAVLRWVGRFHDWMR
jgi:pyruvate/2-oxoglutarate dehydrogenase complex dihydrolipoamide dehydrogenase (E3) component